MIKPGLFILSLCFLVGQPIAESCFAQAKEDKRVKQLENEKLKLDRTRDPANRAKSLMKIAEITLSYTSDAANAGDFSRMNLYVEQYRQAVTEETTRGTMRSHYEQIAITTGGANCL